MCVFLYVCIPLKTNKKDYQKWSYGESNMLRSCFLKNNFVKTPSHAPISPLLENIALIILIV